MFETIVALATPPLRSALSIVRLSGDDSFSVVSKIFSKKIEFEGSNKIYHGLILDKKEIVDEVVLLAYKNPNSFTGEDSVEIISHGSPIITNKIIELCIKNGARNAERGEFSSRSYLHGKMDLIQAESINDLIFAETEESKKISMLSLQGETSKLVAPLKAKLGDLLSLIEVNINYPEYTDIEEATNDKIVSVCSELSEYINELIRNGKKGQLIKDGVKVAIIGKPNVGKSSLLNAFLGEEKAIVTDIEGTTRDVVEGTYNLDGILLRFFDTAGIHKSNDIIEEKGIVKSEKTIADADLVIAVLDSTTIGKDDENILDLIKTKNHIVVYNKKDKLSSFDNDKLYISAMNNDIDVLKTEIKRTLGLEKKNFDNPSINNVRELGILANIEELLKKSILDAKSGLAIDLINVTIQDAYLKTLSLLGEDHDFDIAEEIFSRFCVGK